jgi:GT2 family glycosyltransferase
MNTGTRIQSPPSPFSDDLALTPTSRRPTRLKSSTLRAILDREVPAYGLQRAASPAVSIVVVTRDNLAFLRLCLESVLAFTEPTLELIVVDNRSSDGTLQYLARLSERNPNVRLISNDSNRGFAAGSNQGAAAARGDVLVLLNDDTAVGRDWLRPLLAHLEAPDVGMVGPTTNRIGNEAQIDSEYRTWGEFVRFAAERTHAHAGEAFEIPTLTMFCVAMRRALHQRVGPLDERFEVGMLEDDDYSRRVREAGYRLLCADDAFVHHFGETSFGKLVPTGEYARVLAANQARFEEKWKQPWRPYGRRESDRYLRMVARVARAVADVVPVGATVLVVNRGDDRLLKLGDRQAWHFPRTAEAIAMLDEARAAGARYLVVPSSGGWWLEHYEDLRRHLEDSHARLFSDPETCVIYGLEGARA